MGPPATALGTGRSIACVFLLTPTMLAISMARSFSVTVVFILRAVVYIFSHASFHLQAASSDVSTWGLSPFLKNWSFLDKCEFQEAIIHSGFSSSIKHMAFKDFCLCTISSEKVFSRVETGVSSAPLFCLIQHALVSFLRGISLRSGCGGGVLNFIYLWWASFLFFSEIYSPFWIQFCRRHESHFIT